MVLILPLHDDCDYFTQSVGHDLSKIAPFHLEEEYRDHIKRDIDDLAEAAAQL